MSPVAGDRVLDVAVFFNFLSARAIVHLFADFYVAASGWRSTVDFALGQRIGAFRQVCCEPSFAIYGDEPPFIGVRELWWPTVSAFQAGLARDPSAWRSLIDRPTKAVTVVARAERVF